MQPEQADFNVTFYVFSHNPEMPILLILKPDKLACSFTSVSASSHMGSEFHFCIANSVIFQIRAKKKEHRNLNDIQKPSHVPEIKSVKIHEGLVSKLTTFLLLSRSRYVQTLKYSKCKQTASSPLSKGDYVNRTPETTDQTLLKATQPE